MKPYVDILGTRYRIEVHKISEDAFMKENNLEGYCSELEKLIVVADVNDTNYYTNMNDIEKMNFVKVVLRHEIVHAFLDESGLSGNANVWKEAWPKNEEMIDWFAIQIPKIVEAYKWCDCL